MHKKPVQPSTRTVGSDPFKEYVQKTVAPQQDLTHRETYKTHLGFDPAVIARTNSGAYGTASVIQQFGVNASLSELDKRNEIAEVRHGSLVKSVKSSAKNIAIAGKNNPFEVKNDEVVYDRDGTPCRKVITSIQLTDVRNDHPVPIAVKFTGFTCDHQTLHPYSEEPCDVLLEPMIPFTPVQGRVLYNNNYEGQGLQELVRDWGTVTQQRIEASYKNKKEGVVYEILPNSFLAEMLNREDFSGNLIANENYTQKVSPSGEVEHHAINAAIHDKLTTQIKNQLEKTPFFDTGKISVKYSRADGLPWSSNVLGGTGGAVISELSNKRAEYDPHAETRGFGVSLKIDYTLVPIM